MVRFTVWGLSFEVKPLFFVFTACMIFFQLIKPFTLLFAMVTLHELCHLFVARLLGLKPEKLVVTPIGQTVVISHLETLAPYKRYAILLAGVLFNLTMALTYFFGAPTMFVTTNLAIALFNLLPAYPLDGGQIFYFWLSKHIGILPAFRVTQRMGIFFSGLLFIGGVFQLIINPLNPSLLAIAIYILQQNQKWRVFLVYDFSRMLFFEPIKQKTTRILPIKKWNVLDSTSIFQLQNLLTWDSYAHFYCKNKLYFESDLAFYISQNGCLGTVANLAAMSYTHPRLKVNRRSAAERQRA